MRWLNFLCLTLSFFLFGEEKVLDLQEFGKVVYYLDGDVCENIVRLSFSGEILYEFDPNSPVISESSIEDLGAYEESNIEKRYDDKGRLIQKGENRYCYDEDRLVLVTTNDYAVFFTYDNEGKRVAKKLIPKDGQEEEEYYLFLGNTEIGSVSKSGELKWLRIPAITSHPDLVRAIAIETKDAIYTPIYDTRWNIIQLVNLETDAIIKTKPEPFGENLHELEGCPWTFCSKRYDKDIGLVNFGYRDYDPELREWTSLDPFMQDTDPYRYCFGDPLNYLDPDGRFAIAIPILTWTGTALTSPLWGPGALAVATGAAIGYIGYKAYKEYQHWQENQTKEPPYTWDDLGSDPSKCPDEGFEWKGTGPPESGRGNWVRGEKPNREKLNPDFKHKPPVGPHWDYESADFPDGVRIKPDGTWEYKKGI